VQDLGRGGQEQAAQLVIERRRPLGAVAEDHVAIAGHQFEEPHDASSSCLACRLGGDRRLLVVDADGGSLGELPDSGEGLEAGEGLVGRGQRQEGGIGASPERVRSLA
jgi:hypothetical protein